MFSEARSCRRKVCQNLHFSHSTIFDKSSLNFVKHLVIDKAKSNFEMSQILLAFSLNAKSLISFMSNSHFW